MSGSRVPNPSVSHFAVPRLISFPGGKLGVDRDKEAGALCLGFKRPPEPRTQKLEKTGLFVAAATGPPPDWLSLTLRRGLRPTARHAVNRDVMQEEETEIEIDCRHAEAYGSAIGCFNSRVAEDIEARDGRVDRYTNETYELTDDECERGLEYSPDLPIAWPNKPLGASYIIVLLQTCRECKHRETIAQGA